MIGSLRVDAITYTVVEDLKLALARKKITRVAKEKRDQAPTLSPKTLRDEHNVLVLGRIAWALDALAL